MEFSNNISPNSFEEIKEEDYEESPKKGQEYQPCHSNGNTVNLNTFANLIVKESANERLEEIHSDSEEESEKRNQDLNIIRERLNSIKSAKRIDLNINYNPPATPGVNRTEIITPKKNLINFKEYNTCKDTKKDVEININGFNTNFNISGSNNQNLQKIPSHKKGILRSNTIENKENITPKAEYFKRKLNFSLLPDNVPKYLLRKRTLMPIKLAKMVRRLQDLWRLALRTINRTSNLRIR